MRILQITFTLTQGGAERFVVDMCNELVKNPQNEVHLLTVNANTPKTQHYLPTLSGKVKYRNLGAPKGLCIKSITGVYKAIKEIKPDVVHIHCSTVLMYLPALFYKKPKYVQTLHSLANKSISFQWLRKFQGWLFRKHIQPITISGTCQESYKEFYKQDNAICITNGRAALDKTEKYNNVAAEIASYKQGNDVPVFIHVARYSKEKNQKLLFGTFEHLHNAGKKFLLVVIGGGYENSPYMHLNETNYIKILGNKQNVGDYLACANYFVLSSLYEGLPLSLLEAMSMGCIPISTPAGGVVDVIKDGKNGIMSTTFEETDFYNAVARVFENDFSINRADIIKDYKENYTMDVCVNNYYKVYTNLSKD